MFYKKMIILAATVLCMEFAAFGMGQPTRVIVDKPIAPIVDTTKIPMTPRKTRRVGVDKPKEMRIPRLTKAPVQRAMRPAAYYPYGPAPQIPTKPAAQAAPMLMLSPMEPMQTKQNIFERLFGLPSKTDVNAQRVAAALQEQKAAKEAAFNEYIKAQNPYRAQAIEEDIKQRGRWSQLVTPGAEQEESIEKRQRQLARPSFEQNYDERERKIAERDYIARLEANAEQQRENALRRQGRIQAFKNYISRGLASTEEQPIDISETYGNVSLGSPVERAGLMKRFTGREPQVPVLSKEELAKVNLAESITGQDIGQLAYDKYWGQYNNPFTGKFYRRFVFGGVPAIEREAQAAAADARARVEASKKAVQQPTLRESLQQRFQNIQLPQTMPAYMP